MKIAILGGGITGLVAGFQLAKKDHQVTIFEQADKLGGLAKGFYSQSGDWQWPLETFYHHIFANDKDILDFANEIGYKNIFFRQPVTASLYNKSKGKSQKSKVQVKSQKYQQYPLDTPIDLLNFPLLSLP